MNKGSKYRQSKLLIGLLSMLFLVSPSFESDPLNCGMIRVIEKKKKDGYEADEETNDFHQ